MAYEFMTVPDAAKQLGLTPARIYQLIKDELIKADRIGSGRVGIVIRKEEVDRFSQSQAAKKEDAPRVGVNY